MVAFISAPIRILNPGCSLFTFLIALFNLVKKLSLVDSFYTPFSSGTIADHFLSNFLISQVNILFNLIRSFYFIDYDVHIKGFHPVFIDTTLKK